jgi:hypothetical protein
MVTGNPSGNQFQILTIFELSWQIAIWALDGNKTSGDGREIRLKDYWIVIVIAEEVAAPGFTATSDAVPAIARSEAGMATVRWVASTIVVVR